jgi:outer membrane usher protein
MIGRRTQAGLLVALALAAAPLTATAQVLPAGELLDLPLTLNGAYLGDLKVQLGTDGRLTVDGKRVLELVGGRLTPEALARLNGAVADRTLIPVDRLSPEVDLTLDETNIEIDARLSSAAVVQTALSLSENDPNRNVRYLEPAPFAAAVAIDVGGAYVHEGLDDAGFTPNAGRMIGWLNFGGARGVFIDAEAIYDGSADQSFRRGDIRLFKDDVERSVRYTLGDLIYQTTAFQFGPRIGGISVERRYDELAPLRTIRPLGRTSFSLERTATVEVLVNGAPIRTLRFDPGRYDLADIPFAEGGNTVDLIITDDTGRVERLSFDAFSSTTLLDPGLSEFSISAGLLSTVGENGVDYLEEEPAFSAFYRRGLTPNLTAGLNGQAGRDVVQIGAEAAGGFGDILLSGRAAASRIEGRGVDVAAEANLLYSPEEQSFLDNFIFDLNARYTGEDFGGLGLPDAQNRYSFEFAGRVSATLLLETTVGLSAAYQIGRGGERDVWRTSLTASRSFGVVGVNVTYDKLQGSDGQQEDRLLFSVNFRPPIRSSIGRATYDSSRSAYRAELQTLPRNVVGNLSGQLAVEHSDDGSNIVGGGRYRANRFTLAADHSLIYGRENFDLLGEITTYSLSTGVAYADGAIGVGPVGEGSFVLLKRGRAVSDGRVVVNRTPEGVQAQSDLLGPALYSGFRGYAPGRVNAELETSQLGFETAAETINVFPGARTGYVLSLGDKIEITVVGSLRTEAGEPVSLAVGRVEPVSGGAPASETFTNRSGRFAVDGLQPGDYRIVFDDLGSADFRLTDADAGVKSLGDIVLRANAGRSDRP